jgi:23S rRNA pseudouridine1911/1915/1917 synthase
MHDPSDLAEDVEPALEASQEEVRTAAVPVTLHGQRLDRVLAQLVPEFSRSYLQQLIEQGEALIDGRVTTKVSAKVRLGHQLQITLRATPGLVVHPAPGNWRGTLLNGLLALDPKASEVPRAGIVHRLDKDTSGLMVVARTRQAMDALVDQIAARQVHRQYLALGHKNWTSPSPRTLEAAIGRDPANRLRMAVVDLAHQSGKTAATTFDLLDQGERCCLVQCTLHTGRTHQIRVHMAHLGHPLLGDAAYGGAPLGGMTRQALHAWRLAFEHPITGEQIDLTSALPEDMAQALQNLGLSYNPPP